MWQGTPRALVAAALPRLQPTGSPALQDLSRRLLLSNAVAPQGADAPDAPSLGALRVDRLMALGDVDDALALIDALPTTMGGEELDRDRVELRFAEDDTDGACRDVQSGIGRHQGVWWDRALIACQALAGDKAKAALGLEPAARAAGAARCRLRYADRACSAAMPPSSTSCPTRIRC